MDHPGKDIPKLNTGKYIYNNIILVLFCGQKFVLCFYVLIMQNKFMDAT